MNPPPACQDPSILIRLPDLGKLKKDQLPSELVGASFVLSEESYTQAQNSNSTTGANY